MTVGGAVIVGVAIGDGIDAALGLPELVGYVLGGEQEGENGITRNGRYFTQWLGEEIHLGQVESCEQPILLGAPGYPGKANLGYPEPFCVFLGVGWSGEWSFEVEESGAWVKREGTCTTTLSGYSEFGIAEGNIKNFGPSCEDVPEHCMTGRGIWWECELFLVPGTEGEKVEFRLWSTLSNAFSWAAFPSHTDMKLHSSTPLAPAVPAKSPVSPITPPAKTDVPAPARHHIIEKATDRPTEKELEEQEKIGIPIHPNPLIIPIEKGGTIPSPTNPVVPTPSKSGELFPEYAEKVEQAGFTVAPESYILPESAIDTSVGPNDVSDTRISPAPGTSADPTTKIRVGVNPADAPVPSEGHVPISGPTLPGINFPNFGVLCKGFPFGVPCWLAETIEGWSTASKPPEWGISSFSIEGHSIPGAKFNLAKLEPIMEVVRPAMIVFATIGLVLLFYTFAKGGGPPSGSGGDSGAREVDIPEGGGTYWES